MAKKKDEKDVLIVRDEKTGEISVITEITYLLGKGNLTIADYLDNVLNEHFQTHRAEINRMLDSVPKVEL